MSITRSPNDQSTPNIDVSRENMNILEIYRKLPNKELLGSNPLITASQVDQKMDVVIY